MSEVVAVYADGGVIGRNPSALGGTWAFCFVTTELRVVDDVEPYVVRQASGQLLAPIAGLALQTVSNNVTEYYAAAKALAALPDNWSGQFYSDSWVTLCRFFKNGAHNGIPDHWKVAMRRQLARLGKLDWTLLDGHPTKAQLAAGIGKRGNPCSSFNVYADQLCNKEALRYRGGPLEPVPDRLKVPTL